MQKRGSLFSRIASKYRSLLVALVAFGMALSSLAAIPPQPPTVSTDNSAYIYVRWPKNSGATTGYAIYRSTSPTFNWNNRLATTSNTCYYDYSATHGKTYYYWIGFRDASYTIYIDTSKYDWGKRPTGVPFPPGLQASTNNSTYIHVSWSAVSGATTGYAIFRSTSPTFSWANRLSTTTYTDYHDYSAMPGVRYYYWIGPRTASYRIDVDSSNCAWGMRPGGLMSPQPSASTNSDSYVYLSWSAVSGASNGYAIFRSLSPTFSWSSRLATTPNTHYYDYSALPGVKYYYWIGPRDSSCNVWINSSKCDWGMRTGGLTSPQPTATTDNSSYIKVSWSAVSGATTGYAIYRSTLPTFSWTNRLATTSNAYYYDYSAEPNVRYYYWIGPRDASYTIHIDSSKYDWGMRMGEGLVPPKPLVTANSSYIRVSWSAVSGASNGYAIYRSTSPTFSWNIRLATTSNTYYYDYSATLGTTYYYWIGPRDASYRVYVDTSKYGSNRRVCGNEID